jgi:hypothetical protein
VHILNVFLCRHSITWGELVMTNGTFTRFFKVFFITFECVGRKSAYECAYATKSQMLKLPVPFTIVSDFFYCYPLRQMLARFLVTAITSHLLAES